MKKIGCVLAFCNNYGTMLQSYATIKILSELGNNVEIIRYIKKRSLLQTFSLFVNLIRIGDFAQKVRLLKRKVLPKILPQYRNNMEIRAKAYNRFAETRIIPYFKKYNGYAELVKGAFNYDICLVGSDQQWAPMSLYSKYSNLLFVDDSIPKVAYAASFGVSEIPSFQKTETKRFLERFRAISVRELSGKEIVESISSMKAQVVLDPSMLLTRLQWEDEIKDSSVNNQERYIFCYFLGKNMEARDAVERLKKKTGLKILSIKHNDEYIPQDEKFGDEALYDVDPFDFVKYISQAEYVCTDSFHCSVFSILFHKKFLTFYRYAATKKGSRNGRIDSLFTMLESELDDLRETDKSTPNVAVAAKAKSPNAIMPSNSVIPILLFNIRFIILSPA